MSMTASPQQLADGSREELTAIDLVGQRVHFVGIGGCGMSGLARLAQQRGAICTGTDRADSSTVAALRDSGIAVSLDQASQSVPDDCDLMVISAAIKADHPELAEADRRGVSIVKYAQLLGRLMIKRTGVAIAGTHGKSTTTSLLSHVLISCGLDPSLIVGAECKQIGGGWRVGAGDLLVAEACEYDRSFCYFHPEHAVILNIEEDHLDMYKGIDDIVEAFADFTRLLPRDGSLLVNHEMPHRLAVSGALHCVVETIGFAPQADWRVQMDSPTGRSTPALLYNKGKLVAAWASALPGEHMAYNAAVAAVTAHRLGVTWDGISQAIGTFEGLDRRMQRLGQRTFKGGRVVVVDDYGHHPTEIDTTLRALRQHYQPRQLVCVFQPHQHSRTLFLLEQFAASFSEADQVIVPEIFFVRDSEQERHKVRAADLVDRLRQGGKKAMHLHPLKAIVEQLELIAWGDGDLLVTMGAGNVWQVARDFLGSQ